MAFGLFFEPPAPAPRVPRSKAVVQTGGVGCDACSLKRQWPALMTARMPMVSTADSDILILGEAPGKDEDLQGKPFVGDSGKMLRNLLPGRDMERLAWQNTVRCRPPENATPTPQDSHACFVHLENDIQTLKPKAILGIGSVPLGRFLPGYPIFRTHGQKFPVTVGTHTCWYYPVIHPSFVLRTGDKNSPGYGVLKSDLKKFFNEVDRWPNAANAIRSFTADDTVRVDDAETAHHCLSKMVGPVALDFETQKLRPYEKGSVLLTAAVSDGTTTIAFSVNHPEQVNLWAVEFLRHLVTTRTWIAHNLNMELAWLFSVLGDDWFPENIEDTMVMYRMRSGRAANLSLGDLTRFYFGVDIKKLSHLNMKNMIAHPLLDIIPYNGTDAQATALLWRVLEAEMPRKGLDENNSYRRNVDRAVRTIRSTTVMEVKGLHTDPAVTEKLNIQYTAKIEQIVREASKLYEVREFERQKQRPFNIASSVDIGEALVEFGKCALPKTAKGNQYSTEDDELEKLALENPLAKAVQDYREMSKLKSTYVEPYHNGSMFGADNLIHPPYSVLLVETGRLSSYIHTFPKRKNKEVRNQIIAPPGMVFLASDMAQLEARLIAMASKDKTFCEEIINEVDTHIQWRDNILKVYPDYLDRVAHRTGLNDPAKVMKAARDIAKNEFVFASFYGSTAAACAERMGIPLAKMQLIHDKLWATYPGVQKWINTQRNIYKNTGTITTLTGMNRHAILKGQEPINNPIQGTGAHVVLEAQNALYEMSVKRRDPHLCPRMNIHDDLMFCVPDDDDAIFQYAEIIGAEMVRPRFSWVTVPFATEIRIGKHWGELEPITVIKGEYYH